MQAREITETEHAKFVITPVTWMFFTRSLQHRYVI